jgi:hypothetical protein
MAKDPITSLPYEPDRILEGFTKQPRPILDWVFLYENGSSTTKIAKLYHVGVSTVRRHLVDHTPLRDRISASIAASTKYVKKAFFGDLCEGAFLAGFVEDCHVRRSGRLTEVTLSTTHPAMGRLFDVLFKDYGHLNAIPHFEGLHGYYQYIISVYLDRSFESFLLKTEHVPQWVPLSKENSIFLSYLSGIVAAEGCVRLYDNHGHTDTALAITLKRRTLLEDLSSAIGGRIYDIERASRLVIYGKAAAKLMGCLNTRHEEKDEKARLVIDNLGQPWSNVRPVWQALVNKIKSDVVEYRQSAKLGYIQKHGSLHPRDQAIAEMK